MEMRRLSHPRTRLVLNTYSLVWEPVLRTAQRLGLSKPNLEQNWLTVEDIDNLLLLSGFERIRRRPEILLPLRLPVLAPLFNQILVKLWPLSYAALTNFIGIWSAFEFLLKPQMPRLAMFARIVIRRV